METKFLQEHPFQRRKKLGLPKNREQTIIKIQARNTMNTTEISINPTELGISGNGSSEYRKYVALQCFREAFPSEVLATTTVKFLNFETSKWQEKQEPKVVLRDEKFLPEISWVKIYTASSVYEYKVFQKPFQEFGVYRYIVTFDNVLPRKNVA